MCLQLWADSNFKRGGPRILGLVDDAHATGPELVHNPIMRDDVSDQTRLSLHERQPIIVVCGPIMLREHPTRNCPRLGIAVFHSEEIQP